MKQERSTISLSAPDFGAPDVAIHVVLVSPEIPQNTGNIARLCAATGAWLHLVEPLGYTLHSKYLRRAGLDYWPAVRLSVHPNWEALVEALGDRPVHLLSKWGSTLHTEERYRFGTIFLFGSETRGLPAHVVSSGMGEVVRIPMNRHARSLNLANSVAITVYEALRQQDWRGDAPIASHDPVAKPLPSVRGQGEPE